MVVDVNLLTISNLDCYLAEPYRVAAAADASTSGFISF
jgi:hypothetical protein